MKATTGILNKLNEKDYSVDINSIVEGTQADDFYYACNDIEQLLFKLEKRIDNQDILNKLYNIVVELNSIRMEYYKELNGKEQDVDDGVYESAEVGKVVEIPKEIIDKVQAEYEASKEDIRAEIKEEMLDLVRELSRYGMSKDEIMNLKEIKAYKDAYADPEDIWCNCKEEHESDYKPDGESYLGVEKHAYICKGCKKFTQIG